MMFHPLARSVLLLLLLAVVQPAHAQTVRITGRVLDDQSGVPLQFANVVLRGENTGTTTDNGGRFTLLLSSGTHTLQVSYLGYETATKRFEGRNVSGDMVIRLTPDAVKLPAVRVTPADNPALPIIRGAIAEKKRQRDELQSYRFSSHSKMIIRATGLGNADARSDGGSVTVSGSAKSSPRTDSLAAAAGDTAMVSGDSARAGSDSLAIGRDSTARVLTVLLESQTDAHYDKELGYKEIVTARKQSAFLPAASNLLIGAFFTADFSGSELRLGPDKIITAPVSDAGLKRYLYRLDRQTVMDGQKIHVIHFEPFKEGDPLMEGTLYIADSSFALRLADVRIARRALPRFFDSLSFRQNFRPIDGRWWMPADVVVGAKIGIHFVIDVDMSIEGLSLLQDWEVNGRVDSSMFDRTRIKVLKEADKRDSTYWSEHARLPSTPEDVRAYHEADSIKVVLDSVRNDYGVGNVFTGKEFSWDETSLTIPGLLGMYRYNRVEGSALIATVSTGRPVEWMRTASLGGGYGFMDHLWKFDAGLAIEPFGRYGLRVSPRVYHRLASRTEEYDQFGDWISTIGSIVDKSDYRSYFYAKGASLEVDYDALHLFPLNAFVRREWNGTAHTHATWSLFNTDAPFPENPPVNDGWFTFASLGVSYDGRDFIDNAGQMQRIGRRPFVPTLGIARSVADLDNETVTATMYSASLTGRFDVDGIGLVSFDAAANTTQGALTTQQLFTLYGTIQALSGPDRFRTLTYAEFGGDRRAQLFMTLNTGDRLFRTLSLPWLKDSGLGLAFFGGAGWAWMNDHTRSLQRVDVQEARAPFLEAGFAIDNIFSLFRIDLAWRLNHLRPHRNFYIGIDTALF
jgi:hypothetical protein